MYDKVSGGGNTYDNSVNDCNIYDTINVGGNGIVIK